MEDIPHWVQLQCLIHGCSSAQSSAACTCIRSTWHFPKTLAETLLAGMHSPCLLQVKSSASGSKDVIDITPKELAFASEHGCHYWLYRVVGAGGASPAIVRLRDPADMLRRKQLSLCLIV